MLVFLFNYLLGRIYVIFAFYLYFFLLVENDEYDTCADDGKDGCQRQGNGPAAFGAFFFLNGEGCAEGVVDEFDTVGAAVGGGIPKRGNPSPRSEPARGLYHHAHRPGEIRFLSLAHPEIRHPKRRHGRRAADRLSGPGR